MLKGEPTEFEKKWGVVCPRCKKRKGTVMASVSAEGGKPSVCVCDNIKL